MSKTSFKQDLDNIKDKWLLLSIGALLAAGLLTFIIVFSRTPGIKEFFIFKDLFNKALVIHVDLSQLYWFLAIGLFLTFKYLDNLEFISKFTFKIALASLLGLIISAFIPSTAILNNYIPVIDNLLFFLSLSVYLTIIVVSATYSFIQNQNIIQEKTDVFKSLLTSYNLILIIAFLNFVPALNVIKHQNVTLEFYEIFFWGFGHILQFAYVVLMVTAWLLILKKSKVRFALSDNALKIFSFFYVIIALYAIIVFANARIPVEMYKAHYTRHMIYGSSFLPIVFMFFLAFSLFDKKFYTKDRENRALLNCLIGSVILFAYGGYLGNNITVSNTVIPAHYHGSTVAVTIALIAITYLFLPKVGGGKINSRMAVWQPVIYATGQIIHITGLAISGGYGALRKTPDSIHGFSAKFWMGVMGMGGLITMIAGLMFLIICYKSITSPKRGKNG